jgi:hypothetical protein
MEAEDLVEQPVKGAVISLRCSRVSFAPQMMLKTDSQPLASELARSASQF